MLLGQEIFLDYAMNKIGQIGATPMARTHVMTTVMAIRSEPGKGYDNPKLWGDVAYKGDIFQVRKEDAGPIYVEGDFLIAKVDMTQGLANYPACGSSNDYWQYAWTKTTNFTLILETGNAAGAIYGNGLNQIGVQVHFQAADDNGIAIPLSPAVVQHAVQLLDYTSGQALPNGWNQALSANQYHTLPHDQRTALNPISLAEANTVVPAQNIQYLSCAEDARSRVLTVGAKITTSSGKGYISSYDGDVHSSVTISALEPKRYDLSNTRLDREDTATVYAAGYPWDQDNYYFSIQDSDFRIVNADEWGAPATPKAWSCIPKGNRMNYHFMWNFGPEDTKEAIPFDNEAAMLPVITGNQRSNAVCLTRLAMMFDWGHTDSNWYFETRFRIYDQYGNSSVFSAVRNEDGWGNLLRVEAGEHTSKG